MVTVRELKGWPHCFTLASGKTLRLLPHQEKEIPSSSVSEDLQRGVSMGYIVILSEKPKANSAVNKHSKQNKDNKLEV